MSFIKVAPTWGEYFDSFYSNCKMQLCHIYKSSGPFREAFWNILLSNLISPFCIQAGV